MYQLILRLRDLEVAIPVDQFAPRIVDLRQAGDEGDDRADLRLPCDDVVAAKREDPGIAELGHQIHRKVHGKFESVDAHVCREKRSYAERRSHRGGIAGCVDDFLP